MRFFRSMNMLLGGGVPLVQSLHFAKKAVNNGALAELISETELKVVGGKMK